MAYVPKACGFVLTRESARGWEYLLLTSRKHAEAGLPKGHVDGRETEIETALRETKEETGLELLLPDPFFRTQIRYEVERKGRHHLKTVVYLLARTGSEQVLLSDEHTGYAWLPLADALQALPYESLREVVRRAALFLKDPCLFEIHPTTEVAADAHLCSLSGAHVDLVGHLRGCARIARSLAQALGDAGRSVDSEAAAIGALLHDVGRGLGRHEDHQLAGLHHLRQTFLAPYGFGCISHFTKGAFGEELVQAGLPLETVTAFQRSIDTSTLTWEEHCVALADACMMGTDVVPPWKRFENLRRRYDTPALIDLQERRTEAIRRTLEAGMGQDPLHLVGLAR